jgi:hypothetical protein
VYQSQKACHGRADALLEPASAATRPDGNCAAGCLC